MMTNLYRVFGALVLAATLATLGTGWSPDSAASTTPDGGSRSSSGSTRGTFILFGGK